MSGVGVYQRCCLKRGRDIFNTIPNVHPGVIEHFLVCCRSTSFCFYGSHLHIIYAIFLSVFWVYFRFVMFCPCVCPPSFSTSSLPALTLITLKRGPLSFLLSLPAFCEVPLWVWIWVYSILTTLANLPIFLLVLSIVWTELIFFYCAICPAFVVALPHHFRPPGVTASPSAQTRWPFSSGLKAFQSTPPLSLVCAPQNVTWSKCKSVNTWHAELQTHAASWDSDLNESSQATNTM